MGRTKKYPKIESQTKKWVVLVRFSRNEIKKLNKSMKEYQVRSRNEYLKNKALDIEMPHALNA